MNWRTKEGLSPSADSRSSGGSRPVARSARFASARSLRSRADESVRPYADRFTCLACPCRGPLLTHGFQSLERELQPLTSKLGAGDDFFDVAEHLRVAHLFPQLFQERIDLGEHKHHLPADCRLDEQVLTQC